MAEDASSVTLLRLMSWLSPAFPVGAFAYSHGLERAIHDGLIKDRVTLAGWLEDLVTHGSGWNDAVLLAEAWRDHAIGGSGTAVAELAQAIASSRERHLETTLQGAAFVEAVENWARSSSGTAHFFAPPASKRDAMPYPIAVGLAAARADIQLEPTLTAFLHAFTSNLIQAAVRLVPLGQRDGVAALASLESLVLRTAARATNSTLDDLGSCTVMSDILSMKHETQYSRVFRS